MAETPTLFEVINNSIDMRLFNLHTCLPCIVETSVSGIVSVRPALKRKFTETVIVEMPIIQNVPVMFPHTAKFSMDFPVEKGDAGVLVFSERSLDVWKKTGGIVDPKDPRKFDLTDAFFWPGGALNFKPIAGIAAGQARLKLGTTIITMKEAGDISLKNSAGEFKLTPAGTINFIGSSDELLNLLSQFMDEVSKAQTAVGPLLNAALLAAFKTRMDALKG